MIEYITTWLQLKSDRRAVTALEYGLIASLISQSSPHSGYARNPLNWLA